MPPASGIEAGVLHIYLKALRWPDGHLRAKGFAAFEVVSPRFWSHANTTFRHPTEVRTRTAWLT